MVQSIQTGNKIVRGKIKDPTYRKILNRGFTPVRYYTKNGGWQHGWIYAASRKYFSVNFMTHTKRISMDDPNLIEVDKCGRELPKKVRS